MATPVILKVFALNVFVRSIFVVIYYSRFQEAVTIGCSKKNSFKLNFRVFNVRAISAQSRIINNCENFQNYGTCTDLLKCREALG